ncbi:ATPase inhibitor, mitochondrial [Pimephales promelas]|nr:ATPase inhibitor, mitochondrial [Pimephales promelas]
MASSLFCGRLFPCSELLLLLQEGHKLCCSVCGVCSVMARLLLRASVRGYFTSPLRRGSDQLGDLGSGAGKGGGSGGSIREAGGAFGKKQAADEERYFKQKEKEQLAALKKHHEEEIDHHKKEVERLQREIDRHKGKIRKLKHDD